MFGIANFLVITCLKILPLHTFFFLSVFPYVKFMRSLFY